MIGEPTFKKGQVWKGYTLHNVVSWFIYESEGELCAVSECGKVIKISELVGDYTSNQFGEWKQII